MTYLFIMEEQNEIIRQKKADRRIGYAILLFFFVSVLKLAVYVLYCTKNPEPVRIIAFNSTGNLKIDDPVTIKGISAGKISDIKWRKQNILVFIKTHKPIEFHYGYRIDNNDVGYMGDRMLSIDLGDIEAPIIPVTDTLKGNFNTGLSEFIGIAWKIRGIVDSLKAVSAKMLIGTPANPSIASQLKEIMTGADSMSLNLIKMTSAISKNVPNRIDSIDKKIKSLPPLFPPRAYKDGRRYLLILKTQPFVLNLTSMYSAALCNDRFPALILQFFLLLLLLLLWILLFWLFLLCLFSLRVDV